MKLTTWFAHNPVAANMLMGLVLVFGILGGLRLPTEVIPNIELDWVNVNLPFKGLAASEIESEELRNFEKLLLAMKGVKEVHTSVSNGEVNFRLLLEPDSQSRHWQIQADIRNHLNRFDRPEGSKNPSVQQVDMESPVTQLFVAGDLALDDLAQLTKQLQGQLERLPAVGRVDFFQKPSYEVKIELIPSQLLLHGIEATQLVERLRQAGQQLSIGQLSGSGQGLALIAQSQAGIDALSLQQLSQLQVNQGAQLQPVRLSDVASIHFPQAIETAHRVNGQPAFLLSVFSKRGVGLIDTAQALEQHIQTVFHAPQGVEIGFWQNTSKYYLSRSQLLERNGLTGLLLLLCILSLALAFRVGFWVALGIPIAFCGALGVLWVTGQSMNMVTQFAFILVMGVLVDDAIIVGESIYAHQAKGFSPMAAAVYGVQRVARPVFVAVITTIIMFVPLLFLPGDEGRVLQPVPIVVIAALTFSLIESLLVLPAHLSHTRLKLKPITKTKRFGLRRIDVWQNIGRLSGIFIHHRALSLSCCLGGVLIVVAIMASGRIPIVFFSDIDSDVASAKIEMLPGASEAQLQQALQVVEAKALLIQANHHGLNLPAVQNVLRLAVNPDRAVAGEVLTGVVALEMSTQEQREVAAKAIGGQWQAMIPDLPGVDRIRMTTSLNQTKPQGELRFRAEQREDFQGFLPKLEQALAKHFPGVEITPVHSPESQMILEPNHLANQLGVTPLMLASQLTLVTNPPKVLELNGPIGPTPVKVHWPQEYASPQGLLRLPMMIQNRAMPLESLARVSTLEVQNQLTSYNGQPTLMLRTQIYDETSHAKLRAFVDQLARDYGLQLDQSFFASEQASIQAYLMVAFCFAVFLMYAFIATMQASYVKPLLIVMAIPFGGLGAIVGHYLLGMPITLYSMIGAFAVTGIVVNDNLVLIDEYQQRLSRGKAPVLAIVEAVSHRSRPVLLTTITTIVGILPLVIDTSVQAQFLKPMALSLCFGILFASFATLFFVPLVLSFFDQSKPLVQPKVVPAQARVHSHKTIQVSTEKAH